MEERSPTVLGQPARVFVGGSGDPLLLVHGGWGGAATHWASVWDTLAASFRVVAPDLPGIGQTEQPGLGSLGAYARWIRALLDALELESAFLVGNSFGASVACRFAGDYPDRCRGLVLVNGFPMPRTPPLLRWLGEKRLGHAILRAIEKRVAYTPAALDRAFFDPSRAPEDLQRFLREASPPQLEAMTDVLVQGGTSAPHGIAPLLLWGSADRLPGTSARAARRLRRSWPGAQLALVPRAGHLPQVENPAAFVDALTAFVHPTA